MGLDEVGALQTNVETELLLSLQELVDVIERARFLATEDGTTVVPGRQALGKAKHFYLIIRQLY